MSRFRYIFPLLLIAAYTVTGCGSKETTSRETTSGEVGSQKTIPPEAAPVQSEWHNLDEGLKLASESNQPIYVFVKTKACGWCRKMEQETFTDPEVRQALSNLVPVVLEGDSKRTVSYKGRSYSEAQLVREVLGVRGFPTSVFMEPNGDIIGGLPGYLQPEQMVVITNYVGEGHYKNRSFEDYMKEMGS